MNTRANKQTGPKQTKQTSKQQKQSEQQTNPKLSKIHSSDANSLSYDTAMSSSSPLPADPPLAPAEAGDSQRIVKSEVAFFAEKEQVTQDVSILCEAVSKDEEAEGHVAVMREQAIKRFTETMDKYQEQSQLLDPHLEDLITPLMEATRCLVRERILEQEQRMQAQHKNCPPDDAHARAFPFQLYNPPQLHLLMRAMYTICKTRGYKTVVKFFPHEVSDLEPVLHLLQSQDAQDHTTWQTRYILLLWLSILSIVPFDLSSVDSSQGSGLSLVQSILRVCQHYLHDAGPTREGAAVCIARLLTRPDMESDHLGKFLEWSAAQLESAAEDGKSNEQQDVASPPKVSVFLVTGIYGALVEIFKRGHREQLMDHIPVIFERVMKLAARPGHISSLERKLTTKLSQRIGLTFMPPRVVTWRYKRGQRSLLDNFNKSTGAVGSTTAIDADQKDNEGDDDDDGAEDVDVPEEVEEVIEQLLCGLRDKDTIVRWSAAKGVGRITGRLPKEMADDVVEFVLELFDAAEGDGAWHGGCLALAELARRGLLLPARLASVVPLVIKALVFDVRRGHNSVGAHVRDAACYVCWAFARAYDPTVMQPFLLDLSRQMLVTALFDREVNCRRAASAAFQENVGRQGHENFPHGIEILTAADYFTLGNRAHAYLDVATFVGQFQAYRRDLVEHLVETKLVHWDASIRELSALTLARFVRLEPTLFADVILARLFPRVLSPELPVRHGATLAVAEIVLALGKLPFELPTQTLTDIRNLVMKIEKARLYRGRGGEAIRLAACRLIECVALAGHPLTERAQIRLLDSIEESIKHPKPEVQQAAVASLRALTAGYFEQHRGVGGADTAGDGTAANWRGYYEVTDAAVVESEHVIVKRTVDKYANALKTDDNAAMRRGCALALGALPSRIIACNAAVLERSLDALIEAAQYDPTKPPELVDAEVRKNACLGLSELVLTVGLGDGNHDVSVGGVPKTCTLDHAALSRVMDVLLVACQDYEIDDRGDVGSMVRCEAMRALATIVNFARALPTRVAVVEGIKNSSNNNATTKRSSFVVGAPHEHISPMLSVEVRQRRKSEADGENEQRFTGAVVRWCAERSVAWVRRDSDGVAVKVRADEIVTEGVEPLLMTDLHAPVRLVGATSGVGHADQSNGDVDNDDDDADESKQDKQVVLDGLVPSHDARKQTTSSHHADGDGASSRQNSVKAVREAAQAAVSQQVCTRVLGAMLKQMSEKLDLVRGAAGESVVALVRSQEDYCEYLTAIHPEDLEAVRECVGLDRTIPAASPKQHSPSDGGGVVLDFKAAPELFPRMAKLLATEAYAIDVLQGLCLSTGSITESVSKEAERALVSWCKQQKASGKWVNLNRVVGGVLDILVNSADNDRVFVPALKTMQALLEAQVTDHLTHPRSKWPLRLYATVFAHKSTRNVNKLLAAIPVFISLANYERPVRTAAFSALLVMLGHRFPKVRKACAEQMYVWALAMDAQAVCGAAQTQTMKDDRPVPQPADEELKELVKAVQEANERREREATDAPVEMLPYEVPIPEDTDVDAAFDQVLDVLMVTRWDGPTGDARMQRDNLYDLLKVKQPKKKVRSAPQIAAAALAAKEKAAKEEDSYATLIHDIKMGY